MSNGTKKNNRTANTNTKTSAGAGGNDDAFLAKLEAKVVAIHDRDRAEQQPRPDSCDPRVVEIMTKDVLACRPHDTAERCAQIMWERACGCVPVIDYDGMPIAMVTDRDVCMAAYIQGTPLAEIRVESMMSKHLYAVGVDATISTAEKLMRRHGIRRVPVVGTNGALIGILSFSDIAMHGRVPPVLVRDGLSPAAIAETAAATSHIASRPPPPLPSPPPPKLA